MDVENKDVATAVTPASEPVVRTAAPESKVEEVKAEVDYKSEYERITKEHTELLDKHKNNETYKGKLANELGEARAKLKDLEARVPQEEDKSALLKDEEIASKITEDPVKFFSEFQNRVLSAADKRARDTFHNLQTEKKLESEMVKSYPGMADNTSDFYKSVVSEMANKGLSTAQVLAACETVQLKLDNEKLRGDLEKAAKPASKQGNLDITPASPANVSKSLSSEEQRIAKEYGMNVDDYLKFKGRK
jgi:hypothetical protein